MLGGQTGHNADARRKLIPYAGAERLAAHKESAPPRKPIPAYSRPASALELFRLGWDTLRIAEYWSITEAEALRRLTVERSNRMRRPNPFEAA